MAFTLMFTLKRETKGALVYEEKPEENMPPKIGTLYVRKWALAHSPKELEVTVDG